MYKRQVVGLDDYIFDISITANRPDCQSVLGIAREVAAILGKPLHMPCLLYTSGRVISTVSAALRAASSACFTVSAAAS